MSEQADSGTLPSVNDTLAGLVLVAVYLIRIASAGPEGWAAPWWLTVTTDVVLPILAALYLFAVASYVLLFRPVAS